MSLRLSLARIGFRWRLAAAVVCLLLAAVSAVETRAVPEKTASHRVVVADRPLAAGYPLTSGDLTVVRLPSSFPGAIARPDRLIGRTLAGPVARGEPVTAMRLVDRSLASGLDPGLVALPVDVAADVRGLVRPGSPVDLLAVTEEGGSGRSVARRVLVLGVLAASDSDAGCRLVLAVRRDDAARIAAAGASETFRVAALPP